MRPPPHRAPSTSARSLRPWRTVVLGVVVAAVAAGCSTSAPTAVPPAALTDADVDLLIAAADQVETVMADPALVSLLGVTVPFSVRMAAPPRARPAPTSAARLQLSAPRTARFLGDAPVDMGYLGATFVRAGAVFRRDTSRRDAPANAVRVLLYQRQAGASTATVVGWVDLADSARVSDRRVTLASIGAPGSPSVGSARGSVQRIAQGAAGFGLYDVLGGTLGAGTRPLVVSDSFVVDTSTSSAGRDVITTRIPSASVVVRSQTPAAFGASAATQRLAITVGARTMRVEGTRSNAGTTLTFYNGSEELGTVSLANLPNLGDAARLSVGGAVGDVARRWMNAAGRLLMVTPAAADLAQATGNLVQLLDPVIP